MNGDLWWIQPDLWQDAYASVIERPVEDETLRHVRWQAERRREGVLKLVVALERWYIERHPNVIAFVRLQLIARRVGMSVTQVADALDEASRVLYAA